MSNQSRLGVTGELSGVGERKLLDTPSSNGAKGKSTSATLESSVEAKSQIGFQPTKPLELDENTTNAKLVVTFAAKLGALVVWKRLELADGREVIALCFPTNAWGTNEKGELVIREKK